MSTRSNIVLPESMKSILDMRKTPNLKCRPDVEAALKKYGLIRGAGANTGASGSSAPTPAPSSRFANLGQCAAPDGWRSKNPTPSAAPGEDWVSVSSRRRGGNGGGGNGNGNGNFNNMSNFRRNHYTPGAGASTGASNSTNASASASTTHVANTSSVAPPVATTGTWRASRFQPISDTMTADSMEDRIMGKVRAKVNKLGHSTYDATKAFMQQILDSGETDFLEEFMRFVFSKAALETPFCGLYARFLHELADEFPHLREVMVRKFREYTRVFDDASKAPDVGTSDYTAFVEAQEQKKFRRGYSQFVAELAKLGEVSMDDFRLLVNQIVETIRVSSTHEENRTMCEEVIDCFRTMVQAVNVEWMKEYEETLRSVTSAPRQSSPGLTNKGRFAIMDILDLVVKYK